MAYPSGDPAGIDGPCVDSYSHRQAKVFLEVSRARRPTSSAGPFPAFRTLPSRVPHVRSPSLVKEPTVHETATQAGLAAGPVRPSEGAAGALRPAVRTAVTGGFWHGRRSVIAEVCVPQGPGLLENAGNLENLRLAAGTSDNAANGASAYRGDLPFLDSDIYKWLEAAAWQSAETPLDPAVAASRDLMVEPPGPGAGGRRLPQLLVPGHDSRPPLARLALGPRALLRRPPDPGGGGPPPRHRRDRPAGHCCPLRRLRRRGLRARAPGRRRLRPRRDRDRAGRALPRDAGSAATSTSRTTSSSAAATAC